MAFHPTLVEEPGVAAVRLRNSSSSSRSGTPSRRGRGTGSATPRGRLQARLEESDADWGLDANASIACAEPQADSADGATASGAACAVHYWDSQAQTLSVVHVEQSTLTPERIADVAAAYARSQSGHHLTEVRLIDSSREPRVQIADFVAGIARVRERKAGRQATPTLKLQPC
jgi:hypothetical protein